MKRWWILLIVMMAGIGVSIPVWQLDRQQGDVMAAPVEELVKQLGSSDFNQRALALAELIGKGKVATPDFMEALKNPDVQVRSQAAQGLAEIADPASADALAQALDDSDDQVRAHAAQGLARLKDSRAIDALVRTINDFPDVLHSPYTLSTYRLIEVGVGALPAVMPLLKSPDPMTRQRAFVIVQTVVSQQPEFGDWNQLWQSLGRYNPNGTDLERNRAAEQWLTWVKRQSF